MRNERAGRLVGRRTGDLSSANGGARIGDIQSHPSISSSSPLVNPPPLFASFSFARRVYVKNTFISPAHLVSVDEKPGKKITRYNSR